MCEISCSKIVQKYTVEKGTHKELWITTSQAVSIFS